MILNGHTLEMSRGSPKDIPYVHVFSHMFTLFHVFSELYYVGDLGDLGLRLLADPLKNNNKKKHKDHGNLHAMQAAHSMIISIDSIAASSPRISRPQPVPGAVVNQTKQKKGCNRKNAID